MAQVEVVSETETGSGWNFEAQILDNEGTLWPFQVTLSWADYNLWSASGADEPNAVACAVLAFLASRMPAAEIRTAMDGSLARRLFDDADERIPGFIVGRSGPTP